MSKKHETVSDQVRRAIDGAGVSRHRICKAAGIDEAAVCRFMAGKTALTLTTLDALAPVLGLRIVVDGPVKVAPKKKAGRPPKAKKGGNRG